MAELVAEIRGIAGKRPVRGEEFESIKRNMVLRLPGRFETLRSLESATEELINFGYPPEYYYEYARNVRNLTEQDLNAAAAKFIDPDRITLPSAIRTRMWACSACRLMPRCSLSSRPFADARVSRKASILLFLSILLG